MGYQELVASLHKEGEEKVRAVREKAEAEVQKVMAETQQRLEQIREKYKVIKENSIKEEEEKILSDARYRARSIMIAAENTLSEQLFPLALSCLHILRDKRYKDVFASLVKELPPFEWKEIRVNPEDMQIAQEYFPEAQIMPDEKITGGLEAVRADRKMHVINTFEKRLERAWEEILPLLIKDICET